MQRSIWPFILVIDTATWDDRHNLKFSMLLVLKIASLLGLIVVFTKVTASALRPWNLDAVALVQVLFLFLVAVTHFSCRNLPSVRRGGKTFVVSMGGALILAMLSSRNPYYSGAHQYVSGLLLFAGFLLGFRYTLGVGAVFACLYCGFALGLWRGWGILLPPSIMPVPVSLYIDRLIELGIVTLFVGLYHRLKQRQYRIIADQERANIQKEKLLSINRMAGGIAHEINNPLSIVMGYIEIMSAQDPQVPLDRRVLSRITSACERIASIVNSILKLTRDGGGSLEDIDLRASCQHHCQELHQDSKFAAVRWDLGLEPLHLRLPSGYWDLIVVSILKNAFEAAAPGIGPEVRVQSEVHGSVLLLVVSDNGPAFDENEIPNFFEPFYTSKSEVPGRGMGLSIAYVLATRLGWAIEIRREGAWTRVILKIPQSA